MENILNIVMICDKNFVIPTGVCIQSIIQNKNEETKITIHIIAQDITESQQVFLNRFSKAENIDIHLILTGPSAAANLFDGKSSSYCNATDAALYKFYIPEILHDIPKVLYLDSDTIVQQDLSALYHTDIENYYAGVIRDIDGVFKANKPWDLVFPQYFNSGVMLLNLDQLRKNGCTNELIRAYENMDEKMRQLVDQNPINEVFEGHVIFLPVEYNFMYTLFANHLIYKASDEEQLMADIRAYYGVIYTTLSEMLKNSAIIHFGGRTKPWRRMIDPYHDEWYASYQALIDQRFFHETKSPGPFESNGNTKVSVIVPVHNNEKWLQDCLDSIIDQDYDDLEIICINDGSADFSPWILEEYAKKDSRICLFHQINCGPGCARNMGLKLVSGKYIMFVDSDDKLVPGIIRKLVMKAEAENLQMVLFDYRLSFEDDSLREKFIKQAQPNPYDYPGIYEGGELFTQQRKNQCLDFVVWKALYNQKWLKDNQIFFPEIGVHEDQYWVFACYLLCERCGFLKEDGYIHYIRNGSIMQTSYSIENVRGFYNYTEMVMKLGSEHSDTMNKYPEFYKLISQKKQYLYMRYKKTDKRIRREAKTAYDHMILDDLDVISSVSNKNRAEYQVKMQTAHRKEIQDLQAAHQHEIQRMRSAQQHKIQKMKTIHQHELQEVFQSYSWKIGNALIQPFHLGKRLWKKVSSKSQ